MKVTKTQLSAIAEIKQQGGAVLTSEWVSGNGRFTTKRAIPPCCERIEKRSSWFPKYPQRIKRKFTKHPRCQALIAITDMRTANRLLKNYEEDTR
jgi:hypothetical protein